MKTIERAQNLYLMGDLAFEELVTTTPAALMLERLWVAKHPAECNEHGTPFENYFKYLKANKERCENIKVVQGIVLGVVLSVIVAASFLISYLILKPSVAEILFWDIVCTIGVGLFGVLGLAVTLEAPATRVTWDMFVVDVQKLEQEIGQIPLHEDELLKKADDVVLSKAKEVELASRQALGLKKSLRSSFKEIHHRCLVFSLVAEDWDEFFNRAREIIKKEAQQKAHEEDLVIREMDRI